MHQIKEEEEMDPVLPRIDFYQQVVDLITNPQFQFIRRSYMNTWSDVETLFLFIKTAEHICDEYQSRYNRPILPDQLRSALRHVFENRDLRLRAIDLFREYQAGDMHGAHRLSSNNNSITRLPSFVFLPC